MKFKFIVALFCLFLIHSCKDKKQQENKKITDSTHVSTVQNEVGSVNPLEGYWLSAAYKNELLDNLSPYMCSQNLGNITELWVNAELARVVYGNAEAEELTYTKDTSGQYFEIYFEDDFACTYKGENKAIVQSNGIKETLVKSEEPFGDRSVLDQFVLSHLIVGSYMALDGKVSFKEDGKVEGLGAYESYKVFTSFEALSNFDLIEFRDINGKVEYKAWQIKGDVLILFNIVPGDAYVFGKGKEWKRLIINEAIS